MIFPNLPSAFGLNASAGNALEEEFMGLVVSFGNLM